MNRYACSIAVALLAWTPVDALHPTTSFAADVTATIPKSMPASTEVPAKATQDKAKPIGKAIGKPTANPAPRKKPAKDPAVALLAEAVKKLSEEYKEARKSGGELRTKADFFGESPPPELTPEKVVAGLSRPVATDPAQDAYVRWQLLSAVRGQFDQKLAGKVIAIYRDAPSPPMRLGASPDDRRELEFMLRGRSGQPEADELNEQYRTAVDKQAATNAPVYAFRDLLLAKLPASADSIIAALYDAADRYRTGDARAGSLAMRNVEQLVTIWAIGVDDTRPKVAVAEVVEELRNEPGVEYPDVVEPDKYSGRLKWRNITVKPDAGQLDAIVESMKSVDASFGGGGNGNKGRKAK